MDKDFVYEQQANYTNGVHNANWYPTLKESEIFKIEHFKNAKGKRQLSFIGGYYLYGVCLFSEWGAP